MTSHRLAAHLRGFFIALLLGGTLGACSRTDPSIVAEMKGWTLTIQEVAAACERIYPDMPWEAASLPDRERLLTDLVNNELLLGVAKTRIQEFSWPIQRRVSGERERFLVDNFFVDIWKGFKVGHKDRDAVHAELQREAHLLRIVTQTMAQAESCYAEVRAGLPFETAYEKYALKTGFKNTELDMGWVSPETLPHKIVRKVYLEETPDGDVASPTHTSRGIWIVKILGFRPAEFKPSQLGPLDDLIRVLCYRDTVQALSVRLREEASFKLYEENFPVINRCFNAYWDSMSAEQPKANIYVFLTWRSPVWLLTPEERETPIYEFWGARGTALDFMKGLNDVDTEFWPSGPTREHREEEITSRIDRLFLETEAVRLGKDRDPDFAAHMERTIDEAYLDEFFARFIEPVATVTPEEAQAEYRRDPGSYRNPEKAALTALIFPAGAKDRALEFLEANRYASATGWFQAARAEADADTHVVHIRDTGVLNLEEPIRSTQIRPFLPVVEKLETGDVSDLVDLPDGFAVVRCNYRSHTKPFPENMALPLAEGTVRKRKTDEAIETLLEEAARERKAHIYPERLSRETSPGGPAGS